MGTEDCRPKINYPCSWTYKVIGPSLEGLNRAIAEVMGNGDHTVAHSRSSAGGAYHCLNVTATVESEPVRLDLYRRFYSHPAIRIVL